MKRVWLCVGLMLSLLLLASLEVKDGKIIRTDKEKKLILEELKSTLLGGNEEVVDYIVEVEGDIATMMVPGSPPPRGYSAKSTTRASTIESILAEMDSVNVPGKPKEINVIADVPPMEWTYGCYATAGTMMAGYYDRNGYPNVYTDSTNGGVFPLDTSVWGTIDMSGQNTSQMSQCPLTATKIGLEGRTERGHHEDYWVGYGTENNEPDPYMVGGWEEHEPDCIADFMGTNQWKYGVKDGATNVKFNLKGYPHYFPETTYNVNSGKYHKDGMMGLSEYFESVGYDVFLAYNQIVAGWQKNLFEGETSYPAYYSNEGFTFEDYVAEIDRGNPVIMQVFGHAFIGIGYKRNSLDHANSHLGPADLVICYSTWSTNPNTFRWSYYFSWFMRHYGVSVLNLQKASKPETGDMRVDFILNDSWGDGWMSSTSGKAYLEINDYKFTLFEGSRDTVSFYLAPDTTYTYSFTELGANGNECTWSVHTANGTLLSRGGGINSHNKTRWFDFYLEQENSYSDPLPPQNLQITQVDTTLVLSWSPVLLDIEGNNISSLPIQYIVLRGDSPDFEIAYADRDTVSTTSYTYIPTEGEKLNFFRVIAFYDGSFQMQEYDPLPPNNIAITRNDTLMAISWSPVLLDVEGNNISTKNIKYKLFVCDDPEFEVIETEVIEVDATSYNYAILEKKLKYFRVSAYID